MKILKYLHSKINSMVERCFEVHRVYTADTSRVGKRTSGEVAQRTLVREHNRDPMSDTPNLEVSKVYIILLFLLTGCMSQQDRLHKKLSKEDPKNINYQGHYKIGKEYSIKGNSYTPEKNIKYDQSGVASWYGSKHGFHGKNTANGDLYNKYTLTAAHPTLPLPSLVKVTNLENNKSVILMVNDRGPFNKNRILDVSEAAAHVLSFKRQGIAKVRVQYMHKETQDFLKKIALNPKEGSRTAHKAKRKHCSINCHVKLVNLKYNLAITP